MSDETALWGLSICFGVMLKPDKSQQINMPGNVFMEGFGGDAGGDHDKGGDDAGDRMTGDRGRRG